MPGTSRHLRVAALVLSGLALGMAPAWAQVNPGNPSGGTTSLRPPSEDGSAPVLRTDGLAPGWRFEPGLVAWLARVTAGRHLVTVASRPVIGRTHTAVVPKRLRTR